MAGGTNILKNVAADSFLFLVLKIISVPTVYLSNLVMARLYGAEIMGNYYLSINIVLSLATICCLGLNTGLLRFVSALKNHGNYSKIRSLFWKSLLLVSGISCMAAVILAESRNWLGKFFGSLHLPNTILTMAIALPFCVMVILILEAIRGLGDIKIVIFQQNVITPVGFLGLIVLLAYLKPSFINFSDSLGLSYVIITLCGLLFLLFSKQLRQLITFKRNSSDQESFEFIEAITYSWAPFLSSLIFICLSNMDSLILGHFSSPETVAYYNAAIKAAPLVTFPLLAINAVVPPIFVKLHQQRNLPGLQELSQTTSRWMYFAALPLAVLIILLAPKILSFFGPEFKQAQFAMIILTFAQLVNVSVGSVGFILLMTGQQWTHVLFQAAVGICSIPIMAVAAAKFGLNGIAVVAAMNIFLLNLALTWAVWWRLKIKTYANKVGWANAGAIVGCSLFFCLKPFAGILCATAIFIIGYLLLILRPMLREIKILINLPMQLENPE
jgi:O-antigen/teichoic acid export membrane protein